MKWIIDGNCATTANGIYSYASEISIAIYKIMLHTALQALVILRKGMQ